MFWNRGEMRNQYKFSFRRIQFSSTEHPWFSSGTPVSSTNKTNRNDIVEILLKVALNTLTLTLTEHAGSHMT
jgi:hypothetical protein